MFFLLLDQSLTTWISQLYMLTTESLTKSLTQWICNNESLKGSDISCSIRTFKFGGGIKTRNAASQGLLSVCSDCSFLPVEFPRHNGATPIGTTVGNPLNPRGSKFPALIKGAELQQNSCLLLSCVQVFLNNVEGWSVCNLRFKITFIFVSAPEPDGELHVRHG